MLEIPVSLDVGSWVMAPTWPYIVVLGGVAVWGLVAALGAVSDERAAPDGASV